MHELEPRNFRHDLRGGEAAEHQSRRPLRKGEEYAYQGTDLRDATIARFVAVARTNGTGLITTLTEARDPSTLRERRELAYLPAVLRRNWLENNGYDVLANPRGVAGLEIIIHFNRQLVKAFSAAGHSDRCGDGFVESFRAFPAR